MLKESGNLLTENIPITKELLDFALANNYKISLKTGDYGVNIQSKPKSHYYNQSLVDQIHKLYLNGELYLRKYYHIFMVKNPVFIVDCIFYRRGLRTLNSKETQEIYKEDINDQYKQTCREKYRVDNVSQHPEIHKRAETARIKNCGMGDPWVDDTLDDMILSNPDEFIKLPNGEINRFAEMRKIILGLKPKEYLYDIGYSYESEIVLSKRLGIKDRTTFTTELKLSKFLNKLGCNELEYHNNPNKFANCRNLDFVQNAKKLHAVKFNKRYYDMDFYFPKLSLGIEINGLINHSVNAKSMGSGDNKNPEYHFEKFKAFRDRGILMLSFTDFEQDHFKEDYENIIKHHILKEPLNVSKEFLEFNQIKSLEESLNYGLFDPSRFTGNFEDHQHQRFIEDRELFEYWDCGIIK